MVLESDQFDTMLYLLDSNGNVITSNDDAPDTTRSEIGFTAEDDREYRVQVTSFWGDGTGDYRVTLESADAPEPVEPPDFAELLELFELPAQLFEVLADNIGDSTGYAVSEGNVLYSRSFTELQTD